MQEKKKFYGGLTGRGGGGGGTVAGLVGVGVVMRVWFATEELISIV